MGNKYRAAFVVESMVEKEVSSESTIDGRKSEERSQAITTTAQREFLAHCWCQRAAVLRTVPDDHAKFDEVLCFLHDLRRLTIAEDVLDATMGELSRYGVMAVAVKLLKP